VTPSGQTKTFYGWRIVAAVFVLATFGWGLGFYGPPVYLHAVREARGWSLAIVSTGVTVHFLFGAIVVANLPRLYKSFGVATVTKGRVYRIARIPNGVTRHRDRDDRDDLDFVRRVLFKDTGQNGTKR